MTLAIQTCCNVHGKLQQIHTQVPRPSANTGKHADACIILFNRGRCGHALSALSIENDCVFLILVPHRQKTHHLLQSWPLRHAVSFIN